MLRQSRLSECIKLFQSPVPSASLACKGHGINEKSAWDQNVRGNLEAEIRNYLPISYY